ncbi:hypothetical protein GCM10027184_35160 [Saccharothrix stipae]
MVGTGAQRDLAQALGDVRRAARVDPPDLDADLSGELHRDRGLAVPAVAVQDDHLTAHLDGRCQGGEQVVPAANGVRHLLRHHLPRQTHGRTGPTAALRATAEHGY